MQKVAILADSIACLTREIVEQYGITVLPLNFYVGGKIYRDWVDVTPSQAYELFLKDPESFKTSSVSPGECLAAYRQLSQRASNILCVTVSSKISAVYTAALEAKEQAQAELSRATIEVLDSRTVTAAEGFVALAAARAAAEGQTLAEVVKAAEEVREKVNFFIYLDTIRHVYRSGRIPRVASQVGSMLNVRPILTASSGVIAFVGVTRSRNSGRERLLKLVKDKVGRRPVHIAVMHAYAPEEAEKLKELVSVEFNCVELWITEFSPIMGYATGTGTFGLAFYPD